MKTKALMVMLLLLLCSAVIASGNDSEAEEYWRKTQELNRRAEQFKAETGFVGDIGYSYQAMGFTNYRGNFRDIPITAPQDTVAMGQVFEQVLTKVKPYIRAREGQLVREAIVSYVNSTFVTYRQRVNGYGIDGAGVLNIDYNIPTNEIVVTDNTVDILDDNTIPKLIFGDAVRIYDENIEDDEAIKRIRTRRPFLTLLYSNIYNDWEGDTRSEYRLCWVGGLTRCIYIDAHTGQVYKLVNKSRNDYLVNVTAKVMLDSDNTASFLSTIVPLDSTWVHAMCDSLPSPISNYTDNSGYYNYRQ